MGLTINGAQRPLDRQSRSSLPALETRSARLQAPSRGTPWSLPALETRFARLAPCGTLDECLPLPLASSRGTPVEPPRFRDSLRSPTNVPRASLGAFVLNSLGVCGNQVPVFLHELVPILRELYLLGLLHARGGAAAYDMRDESTRTAGDDNPYEPRISDSG